MDNNFIYKIVYDFGHDVVYSIHLESIKKVVLIKLQWEYYAHFAFKEKHRVSDSLLEKSVVIRIRCL